MTNENKSDLELIQRIQVHFETIAPQIVKQSVESLSGTAPIIDFYDADFYLEKIEGVFPGVAPETLKRILAENTEKIDAIFLKYYKDARKPV